MINGHGDDLHNFEGTIRYNFSSNVYYKGCNSALLQHLEKNVGSVQNYPSPIAEQLNVLAGKHFELPSNQFLFGNGATELFYLIAQCFGHKKASIVAPTFAEYEDACKLYTLDINFISPAQLETEPLHGDLLFLCNPNNPDARVLSAHNIEQLLKKHPHTFFVIDEAYAEFTNAMNSVMPLLIKYSNLAVIRSLTKTFAIPGLRLGYMASNASFIKALLGYKLPWTVNSIAIAAGEYIFENYKDLCFNVDDLMAETNAFKEELSSLNGFRVVEGFTSYFLVEVAHGTATALKQFLVEKHGILVRDASNFTGIKGAFIRVAVQDDKANKALIKALRTWN